MKFIKITISLLAFSVFSLYALSPLQAQQRSDYRKLTIQDRRPALFFDFITLPGSSGDDVLFASIYSFSYRYLSFRKMDRSANKGKNAFFSPISLNMEVFKSNEEQLRKKPDDLSVKGLESVERAFSKDTAYAETYEESQSALNFLQGNMSVPLGPGIYNYVVQLQKSEKSDPKMSRTRAVRISSYKDMKTGNVLLGSGIEKKEASADLFKLMSLGDNVKYGSDFYALAYIPGYRSDKNYTVTVHSLRATEDDTTKSGQVFTRDIFEEDIKAGLRPALMSTPETGNTLQLNEDPDGFAYALLKIPNSTFENDLYRLEVKEKGSPESVAQTVFRSMWIDMPRSLLSLDFATEMLHYIVDQKTIERLSEGSKAQREQKFRSFWKEKDPTPKTEYNELMAEYYRRIDYAYQHFTTDTKAGFESDQGKIYITYGPPSNIERKFPANGSTVEIWTYPNKKFAFEATTGFGDFKLISNKNSQ